MNFFLGQKFQQFLYHTPKVLENKEKHDYMNFGSKKSMFCSCYNVQSIVIEHTA